VAKGDGDAWVVEAKAVVEEAEPGEAFSSTKEQPSRSDELDRAKVAGPGLSLSTWLTGSLSMHNRSMSW
jgi:hypothetical protein